MRYRLCSNRRSAFTLIELLVVIAIVGAILALTLSAVQKVRGESNRIACANKLRQIALALHQYDENQKRLPPGHLPATDRAMPLTGWTLPLLPYLELTALSDQSTREFQARRYPMGAMPHKSFSTVVPSYLCPADSRITDARLSRVTKHLAAFTSYLGVAGQNPAANDGMLFQRSQTRLTDAGDGLSQTLLLGERPPSADLQFGWWYSGAGQRGRGTGDLILSVREPNLQPIVSGSTCGAGNYPFRAAVGFEDPCGMFHFWSPHSGGANFAFSDASVRFLKYTANDLMPALATRNGGEATSAE